MTLLQVLSHLLVHRIWAGYGILAHARTVGVKVHVQRYNPFAGNDRSHNDPCGSVGEVKGFPRFTIRSHRAHTSHSPLQQRDSYTSVQLCACMSQHAHIHDMTNISPPTITSNNLLSEYLITASA